MPTVTLSSIPGFSDLSAAPLAANKFALGVHLARINQNASFGMLNVEVFTGIYKHGDTVPQPVSLIDGYTYQRSELMYMWTPQNTADPVSGWASYREPFTMWYGIWNVDQLTGKVLSEIGYRGNNDNKDKTAISNDGQLQVFVIAQRQRTTLTVAVKPSYKFLGNMLLFSEQFDNANWVKDGGSTVAANTIVDPLGGTTADAITKGGGAFGNFAAIGQFLPVGLNPTLAPLTFSIWLKVPSGTNITSLAMSDVWTLTQAQAITITTAWQRFTFTCNPATFTYSPAGHTTSFGCGFNIAGVAGTVVHAWGAQLEWGSGASKYLISAGAVAPATFYQDEPLRTEILAAISENSKFSAVNSEIIYMGEFTNGQTVPQPVSAADGRVYAYSECAFQTCWRWTADTDGLGNPIKPAIIKGQLQDWAASVDVSGVVRITNQHVFYELFGRNSYATGKIAVFAFCSRPIVFPFNATQNNFLELPDTTFAPGATVRASTMVKLQNNINQAICSPEFFATATFANGATVGLPTSPLDGYVYARSELSYIWDWADTGPTTDTHSRLCLVRGGVDTNGLVSIDKYRLASGASTVTLSHEGTLRVLVIGKRANSNAILAPVVLTPPDWAGDPIGDRWGDIVDATTGGSQLLQTIQVSGKPRSIATLIDMGSGQVGSNLLENGSFELLADTVSGDYLFAGWFDLGNNNTRVARFVDSSVRLAGAHALYFSVNGSQTIPAATGYQSTVGSSRKIPVKPGELYFSRYFLRSDANLAVPAGLTVQSGMYLRLTSVLGGVTDYDLGAFVPSTTGVFQPKTASVTIPATVPVDGALPACVQVYCYSIVNNPTGAGIAIGVGALIWDTRFDNCELYRSANPTSDEVAKFGSMAPSFAGTVSFTKTDVSVTWTWNINVYRTDNNATVANPNSSQAVTGLTASTLYFWYPFMDEADLLFKMVTTGGVGSPAWAHTTSNRVWSVEQARADHVPLSAAPFQVTTSATGGSGSGSTPPPDNGCHMEGTYVRERLRGDILCETVKVGDWLWDGDDRWVEVLHVDVKQHRLWIDAEFNCGQHLPVTAGHPFLLRDNSIKRAFELCLLDEVPCSTGITHPVSLRLSKRIANKVRISVKRTPESPNTFMVATLLNKPWVRSRNYNTL